MKPVFMRLIAAFSAILLAGCVAFPINRTDVVLHPPPAGEPKPSMTYTILYTAASFDPFWSMREYAMNHGINERRCTAAFNNSGLFSSVKYTTAFYGDVHFDVYLNYYEGGELEKILVMGSLTLLPTICRQKIQLTTDIYMDGDYICQRKYERSLRKIWWFPMLPLHLLGSGMESCEERMIESLCHEMVAEWSKNEWRNVTVNE